MLASRRHVARGAASRRRDASPGTNSRVSSRTRDADWTVRAVRDEGSGSGGSPRDQDQAGDQREDEPACSALSNDECGPTPTAIIATPTSVPASANPSAVRPTPRLDRGATTLTTRAAS